MNFFITGLPRSRTAWFAAYFSEGNVICYHEAMSELTSKDEYWDRMNAPGWNAVGNSDCGLYMGGIRPGCPVVIIERDIADVDAGLKAQGFHGCLEILEESKAELDKINGMRVKFEDIDSRLQDIHEHCVKTEYNPMRAAQYMSMNIQLKKIVPDVESIRVWR